MQILMNGSNKAVVIWIQITVKSKVAYLNYDNYNEQNHCYLNYDEDKE